MILSDGEIRNELARGDLVFEPEVLDINSSSVEMRLHPDLITFPETDPQLGPVNPANRGFRVMEHVRKIGNPRNLHLDPYTLESGRLIIGKTLETIRLPRDIAARIEGKSSLARLGLSIHVTAPTVMVGFQGTLYLEIYNLGPLPIQLTEEMNIAQLILERVGVPPEQPYGGQFQNQT